MITFAPYNRLNFLSKKNACRSKNAHAEFPRRFSSRSIDIVGIHATKFLQISLEPGSLLQYLFRIRIARTGFDGHLRTIIRIALGPPWSDVPHVRTMGYINYTCKYTSDRLERSNCEISRDVLAIPAPSLPS